MKSTSLFVLAMLAAVLVAGCQENSVQPPVTTAVMDNATAIGLIDAEVRSAPDDSAFGKRNFIAILSGSEEVPPVRTHGRGVAKFKLAKDSMSISYTLIVANISNVVGAGVHLGAAGGNGPEVLGLYTDTAGAGRTCGPIARGSFTPADLVGPYAGSTDFGMFLSDLHADSLYVNVRTDDGVDPPNSGSGDYPDGEIRGQLNGHGKNDDHQGRGGREDDHGKDHGRGGKSHDGHHGH